MCSTFGCMLFEMAEGLLAYPYKLLRIVKEPGLTGEILQEACRYDEWSRKFVEFHCRRAGLESNAASVDLLTTVSMLQHETVGIEVGHSRLRRTLLASSLQTHTQSLQDCSAVQVLRGIRNSSCSWSLGVGSRADAHGRPPHSSSRQTSAKATPALPTIVAGDPRGPAAAPSDRQF